MLVSLLLPLFNPAHADEPEIQPARTEKVRYKERTELDFDGLELSATADRPGVGLVTVPRQREFNPLIQLRASFAEEMKQSVDTVK